VLIAPVEYLIYRWHKNPLQMNANNVEYLFFKVSQLFVIKRRNNHNRRGSFSNVFERTNKIHVQFNEYRKKHQMSVHTHISRLLHQELC